jgi:ATP-dependent Clp protease ATP-binding subunit ClpB
MIQKRLVDRLALAMLEGEFTAGDVVEVDAAEGDLVFRKAGVTEAVAA